MLQPQTRAIALWLLIVAAMIVAMIAVGGITRLTESGLSIARWEPLSGAIPPLNEAAWQAEFDRYRATPQFLQTNSAMSLDDFKAIYFWEYVHRLLGRLIGLAFALPLLWFWWRRAIPPGLGGKLAGLLALGALQGAVGWWMVASGLVDRPEVSHIRLAVHLLLALLILAFLVWLALDLLRGAAKMPLLGLWGLSLLFVQFLFGAYVAGLEAGYAFNGWPLMGEELFPAATPMLEPALANLVDNPIVVQFVHRWLGFAAGGVLIWLAAMAWDRGKWREGAALAAAVPLQIALGILTLVSGVRIEIAVAHQAMAALLLAAALAAAHAIGEAKR
ncbi:MAG: COX15/CtaA family protein [Sphingosinicella sp.]